MDRKQLTRFVSESNRIEGILHDPTSEELDAHKKFLLSDATVADLREFVSEIAPNNVLRIARGSNVCVGRHHPPLGGPGILIKLNRLLDQLDVLSPHKIHCLYEDLHPFTDGNGRSGRALWLWMMLHASEYDRRMACRLGFLHSFYYQTLSASDSRNSAKTPSSGSSDGTHKKFPCECGGGFRQVIDTRPQADGSIKRYRKCDGCQGRISTIEVANQSPGNRNSERTTQPHTTTATLMR